MKYPEWLDEVIPQTRQDDFMMDSLLGLKEALVSPRWRKFFEQWLLLWIDTNEFTIDNPPHGLGDEHLVTIILCDHMKDLIVTQNEIDLPQDLDWKLITQLNTYDKANEEELEEEFGHLPKWRWSFDGKTWDVRPVLELFEAGNVWYTIEYYEQEYQRRLFE